MKYIWMFIFTLNCIQTADAVNSDSMILIKSRSFTKNYCIGGKKQKLRYSLGLECLERNDSYFDKRCLKARAYQILEIKEKKKIKTETVYNRHVLTYTEITEAYMRLEANLKNSLHSNTPFINNDFMLTNVLGYYSFILFPITIPIDILTYPFQIGTYYTEGYIRVQQYKKIHRHLRDFIYHHKKPKTILLRNQKMWNYGYELNELFDFENGIFDYCPSESQKN